MERQTGQRIFNAVASVGVALLLGTGMALAASGVFAVADHTTAPMASSPTPDAGASPGAPLPAKARGGDPVPTPRPDALVPDQTGDESSGARAKAGDARAEGRKPAGVKPGDTGNRGFRGHDSGATRSDGHRSGHDECGNRNAHAKGSESHGREAESRRVRCE